jgi:hypothetical protein
MLPTAVAHASRLIPTAVGLAAAGRGGVARSSCVLPRSASTGGLARALTRRSEVERDSVTAALRALKGQQELEALQRRRVQELERAQRRVDAAQAAVRDSQAHLQLAQQISKK